MFRIKLFIVLGLSLLIDFSTSESKCCCYDNDVPRGSPQPFIAEGELIDGVTTVESVYNCKTTNQYVEEHPCKRKTIKLYEDSCPQTLYYDCCCYDPVTAELVSDTILSRCREDGVPDCPGGSLYQKEYKIYNDDFFLWIQRGGFSSEFPAEPICPSTDFDPPPLPEQIEIRRENPCDFYERNCDMDTDTFIVGNPDRDVCSESSPCNTDCVVIDFEYLSPLYLGADTSASGYLNQFAEETCIYIKEGGYVADISGNSIVGTSSANTCVFVGQGGYLRQYVDGIGDDFLYIRDASANNPVDPGFAQSLVYRFTSGEDRLIVDGDVNNVFFKFEFNGEKIEADFCGIGDIENEEPHVVNVTSKGQTGVDLLSFLNCKVKLVDAGPGENDACIVRFDPQFERSVELFRYANCETFIGAKERNPCIGWEEERDSACTVENKCSTPPEAPCHVGSPCNQQCLYIDYNHTDNLFISGTGSFYGNLVYPSSKYDCVYISTPQGSVQKSVYAGYTAPNANCIFVDDGAEMGSFVFGPSDDIIYVNSANIVLGRTPGRLESLEFGQGQSTLILKNVTDLFRLQNIRTSTVNSEFTLDACKVTGDFLISAKSPQICVSLNDSMNLDSVDVFLGENSTCYASVYEGFTDSFICTRILPGLPLFNPCEVLEFEEDCSLGLNTCFPQGVPCHEGSPCNTDECVRVEYDIDSNVFLGIGFEGDSSIQTSTSPYKCLYTTGSFIKKNIYASAVPENRYGEESVCIILDNADSVVSVVGTISDDVIYVRNSVVSGGIDLGPGTFSSTTQGADILFIGNSQIGSKGVIHTDERRAEIVPALVDVCNTVFQKGPTIVFDGIVSNVNGTSGITTGDAADCVAVSDSDIALINTKDNTGQSSGLDNLCYLKGGILSETETVLQGCTKTIREEFLPLGSVDVNKPNDGCLFGPWQGDMPIASSTISNLDYEDFIPNTRIFISRNPNTCSGCAESFENKHCSKRCTDSGGSSFSYTAHFSIVNFETNRYLSIPEGGRCTAKDSLLMILNVTGCTYFKQEVKQRHPCLSIKPIQSTVTVTPVDAAKVVDPGISIHESQGEHSFFVLRGSCLPAGASIEFDLLVEGCSDVPLQDGEDVSCLDLTARLVTGKCTKLVNDWVNCRPNEFALTPDRRTPGLVSFPYDYTKCFFRDRHLLQQVPTKISQEVGGCPLTNCSLTEQQGQIASPLRIFNANGARVSRVGDSSPRKNQVHKIMQKNLLDNYHKMIHKRTVEEDEGDQPQPEISNVIPATSSDNTKSGPVVFIENTIGVFATEDPHGCFYDEEKQTMNDTILKRIECRKDGLPSTSVDEKCSRSNRAAQILRLSAVVKHFSGTDGYDESSDASFQASGVVKIDFARYHPRLYSRDGFRAKEDAEPLCKDQMNVLFRFSVEGGDAEGVVKSGSKKDFIHRIEHNSVYLDKPSSQERGDDVDPSRIDRVAAYYKFESLLPHQSIKVHVYYVSCDIIGEFEPTVSIRVTMTETNVEGINCAVPGAREARCTSRLDVPVSLDGFEGNMDIFGCDELSMANSYITANNSGHNRWLAFNVILAVTFSCIAVCVMFCVVQWFNDRRS